MEIGYIAKRTLVPTLMEWVSKSRIQSHLPEHCIFIMWLNDSIQFNLSKLSIDPTGGKIFIFFNRKRNMVKLLHTTKSGEEPICAGMTGFTNM
ncbi:hypothetical protein [Pedobacter hartonius]|uniref:Uncharacterized protein n=1 Tax=Pedobacter hartonius TaxID=425514 RepID=A0A1H4HFL9_9SPHI|nr:hypothetical protein [Pedobacter hartonius]SEB20604.1 hypothetical protein SAMN05443550_11711 [Pedobacter hartonius]